MMQTVADAQPTGIILTDLKSISKARLRSFSWVNKNGDFTIFKEGCVEVQKTFVPEMNQAVFWRKRRRIHDNDT
jgi:hypothetical protein